MKIIILCFYILLSAGCKSPSDSILQNKAELSVPEIGEDQEILAVQVPAEFPGGMNALLEYIQKEVDRSDEKYEGRVHLTFVITEKGKIRDPRVIRSSDENSNEEAKRIVNGFPEFIPATEFGIPVSYQYSVIIDFSKRSEKL